MAENVTLPPDPTTTVTPVPFAIRWARVSDLGRLMRLYRGQSAASRRFHHPYPFDRFRLSILFLAMLASQRFLRGMIRRAPNYAFLVLVAESPTDEPLLGFATIRFVRRGGEPVWARFGFLVEEKHRRHSVGSRLAIEMYRTAVGLGITRGGGTVLAENSSSAHLVERYGFHLRPTDQVDPRYPDLQNLSAIEDLAIVMERIRALPEGAEFLRAPPAAPSPEGGPA